MATKVYTNTGCALSLISGEPDEIDSNVTIGFPSGNVATLRIAEVWHAERYSVAYDDEMELAFRLFWNVEDCPDRPGAVQPEPEPDYPYSFSDPTGDICLTRTGPTTFTLKVCDSEDSFDVESPTAGNALWLWWCTK